MFGRLGKIFLAALVTELGGAILQAGRSWLDRKLQQPPASTPAPDAGTLTTTPQGTVVVDAEGRTIGFSAKPEGTTKKAPEAPLQTL
jgi:hypothetical protein